MPKRDDMVYRCKECGWNRIILEGETREQARKAHEQTDVHRYRL